MHVPEPPALTPAQVADLLEAMLATVEAEVGALPEEILAWHPADGEWCVKETLGHLIEAEQRGFAGRVRLILEQDDPLLRPWDQQAIARQRQDCRRSGAEVLGEFRAVRRESILQVRGLSDAQLARAGTHAQVGTLRVRDLLHEWVHHDRNHVRQVLANVQAAAWPHMANAQRFSDD